MHIQSFIPCNDLSHLIKSMLIISTPTGMTNHILPDTSLVLSFRLTGTTSLHADKKIMLPSSAVAGISKSPRTIEYAPGSSNLLVIFREAGFSAFTRLPLHELAATHLSADYVFPAAIIAELQDQLANSPDANNKISLVEGFLRKQLIHFTVDPVVLEAARLIRHGNGNKRISEIAGSVYISLDTLEKKFRRMTGMSAKQYSSLVRFQKLLLDQPHHANLTQLALASGYYDQAHFIREFKTFTNQTPLDFFRNSRFW